MKPLRLVAEIDVKGARAELAALVKDIEAGNSRMSSSTAVLHGSFLQSFSEESKKYKEVGAEAEKSAARKVKAAETASQRLKRIQDEWMAQSRTTTISLGPNQVFKGQEPFGPPRPPSNAGLSEASEARHIAAEIEKTRIAKQEAKKRASIKAAEVHEITAYDKLMLREEQRQYAARASAENDFFQRQRQALRAQTIYRTKLYANDAAMVEQIRKTHLIKLEAINNREAGFAKTPFQTMLRNQNEQLSMFKRIGPAAQQAGYQVGDFFVQVASGQSKMVAFVQQAPQFLGFFGAAGSIIGAGVAVLGSFAIAAMRSKESVQSLGSALKTANFSVYFNQLETLSQSFREYSKVVQNATGLDDASLLVIGRKAQAFGQAKSAVDANTQSLIALYGTLENAQGAYRRLQSQTVSGLRIEAQISGMDGGTVGEAVAIQKLRNQASLTEVQRGFDQERAAVGAWERQKNADGKAFAETEKQFADRQAKEILRINRDEQESLALQRTIGKNEVLRIEREFAKERLVIEQKLQANIRAAHDLERAEAVKLSNDRIASERVQMDRLMVAYGASEEAIMGARHAREQEDIQRQISALDTVTVASMARREAYEQQATQLTATQEAERTALAKKTYDERTKKIQQANQQIASSYISIAGVIAETWQVGPLQ